MRPFYERTGFPPKLKEALNMMKEPSGVKLKNQNCRLILARIVFSLRSAF